MASGHASETCRIVSGEVVGIRDPRLHDPTCYIETGVTIRLSVEEVDSRVYRARIERHAACTPKPDETALMDDLTGRARTYLRERATEDAIVEVVEADCRKERGVDLIVVEVR